MRLRKNVNEVTDAAGVVSAPGLAEQLRAQRRLSPVITRDVAAVVTRVSGEIDAENEDVWRRLLAETAELTGSPGSLIVDINGVEFIGVGAFRILVEQIDRCRQRGVEMCVVATQPIIARLAAVCGVASLVPIYPTVAKARAQLAA